MADIVNTGSSPRVWGQAILLHALRPLPGIIPTRVGTRTPKHRSILFQRDHPHACGDKKNSAEGFELSEGSSPRVWGQVPVQTLKSLKTGIIPTRVGTRSVK